MGGFRLRHAWHSDGDIFEKATACWRQNCVPFTKGVAPGGSYPKANNTKSHVEKALLQHGDGIISILGKQWSRHPIECCRRHLPVSLSPLKIPTNIP
jgi:hypothetical protein